MHTLHNLSLLQLRFGHSADAIRSEVCVARLNAPETAKILVARLLPLGDEICIGDALLQAVFVELARDNLSAVEHVVDVAGFLVMDLKDRPQRLVDTFSFMRLSFG